MSERYYKLYAYIYATMLIFMYILQTVLIYYKIKHDTFGMTALAFAGLANMYYLNLLKKGKLYKNDKVNEEVPVTPRDKIILIFLIILGVFFLIQNIILNSISIYNYFENPSAMTEAK